MRQIFIRNVQTFIEGEMFHSMQTLPGFDFRQGEWSVNLAFLFLHLFALKSEIAENACMRIHIICDDIVCKIVVFALLHN